LVIHSLLEVIAGIGLEHLETTALDSLKQRVPALLTMHGTASEVLDQQTARVIAAVDTMLQDSTGRWLLSGEHADAASELALTGMLDGQLINAVIDRTFIDADGVRWIIDYNPDITRVAIWSSSCSKNQSAIDRNCKPIGGCLSKWSRRRSRLRCIFRCMAGCRCWIDAVLSAASQTVGICWSPQNQYN
jgi:ATP-dependent helicase/nuclease subunit A